MDKPKCSPRFNVGRFLTTFDGCTEDIVTLSFDVGFSTVYRFELHSVRATFRIINERYSAISLKVNRISRNFSYLEGSLTDFVQFLISPDRTLGHVTITSNYACKMTSTYPTVVGTVH